MMMMTNHIHMHSDNSQMQIQSPQSIADYLAQLLKDRKQLAALPNVFTHLERLLDEGEFWVKDFRSNYLLDLCRKRGWEWDATEKM